MLEVSVLLNNIHSVSCKSTVTSSLRSIKRRPFVEPTSIRLSFFDLVQTTKPLSCRGTGYPVVRHKFSSMREYRQFRLSESNILLQGAQEFPAVLFHIY